MLHQWVCRGDTAPNLKSLGLTTRLAKALSVILIVCCMLAPKQASAAYASNLQTLYDAINGNAAAINSLTTDLGSPTWTIGYCGGAAPTPINWFLTNIESALGGVANAKTIIQNAIALDPTATETLQNAVGGSFFYNLSFWSCSDFSGSYSGYFLTRFTNNYDQLVNTIIAGQAANSYVTIINALQGKPGAIKTLDTVLYNLVPGYGAVNHTTFLDALTDYVGSTTGSANNDTFSTGALGTCPSGTSSYTLTGTPVNADTTRVTMTASDSFAGDGINDTYTINFAPSPLASVMKNGVAISSPADYTITGNTITLTTVPTGTDIISLSDNVTEYNTYSGTGGANYTVTFPLGPAKPTVLVNGVVQPPANYTIAGSTVTFSTGLPASGTNVMIANYSVSGTTLTFNNPPGCGYQMQANYNTSLGGGGNVAATIALFQAGLGGDTTSNNDINVIISNILTTNAASSPPPFVGNGLDFVTAVPANPGGIQDTDGDGIPDSIDPDIDGDGIDNASDLCPYDPTNTLPGCSGTTVNPDTDGDGIPDVVDSTPNGDGSVSIPPPGTTGTATGTGPGGTPLSGGGSSKPPTNKCNNSGAKLTGSFGVNPCKLTEDNLNLTGNSDFWKEGGKQFADHLDKWWTDQFEPALKNMTAQLNASLVDQSRQQGSTMDSHNITKTSTDVQKFEADDKRNLEPNERVCVEGTYSAPLTNLDYTGTALTGGLVSDTHHRTTGDTAAPGPKPKNANEDTKNQFDTYCKYFNNKDVNAGNNACPTPGTDGSLVNADIEAENFILQDSIDLSKPDQYAAAHAFLTYVVAPKMLPQIRPEVVDTSAGRQQILQRQHIEALRNVAASVVAGIISRRASIPLPKTAGGTAPLPPTTPPPPPPAPAPPAAGSSGTEDDFIARLEQQESGGNCKYGSSPGATCQNTQYYTGYFQWGTEALVNLGCYSGPTYLSIQYWKTGASHWIGPCSGMTSIADFQNNAAVQKGLEKPWISLLHNQAVIKGSWTYACTTQCGHWVTPSGIIACSHLLGAGGCHQWLTTCKTAGDANGTTGGMYMDKFAGFDMPFAGPTCGPQPGQVGSQTGTGTGNPPPPPKPVDEAIYDIRHRAGVPDSEISCKNHAGCKQQDPSYNEIMLALTKERFFDPDYYARMGGNLGQIKQEQSAVKSYISLQLQDIYQLQEQISTLLAAKAAMEYDKTRGNHQGETPVR